MSLGFIESSTLRGRGMHNDVTGGYVFFTRTAPELAVLGDVTEQTCIRVV